MRHLAIIMDGNGRWAKLRHLPVSAGHEQGALALVKAIEDFISLSPEYLTVYALSTDNLKRDRDEVSRLLGVIAYFLSHDVTELAEKYDLKLRFIGDLSLFPKEFGSVLSDVYARTVNHGGKTVVFAIGYGGTEEIKSCFNRILQRREFLADFSPVTDQEINDNLFTVGLPAPDAVLRYGGHQRLSNFLPLQTVYSELFFIDKLWPDYERGDLENVEREFEKISRNFGGRNG